MIQSRENIQVSVVIPMYNAGSTILKCLESVQSQTFRDWEIVIVDDGSSDDSVEKVDVFRKEHPIELQLIRQKNAGVSSARNKGILSAKGKYIAFLDSDDAWLDSKLEIQMQILKENPEIGLLGATHKGSVMKYFFFKKINRLQFIPIKWLPCKNFFVTSAVISEKNNLIEVGLFDEKMRYSEDLNLWLRIAQNKPCFFLNEGLVYRLDHLNQGLTSHLKAMEKGELENIRQLRRRGIISWIEYFLYSGYSLLKYLNRIIRK